MSYSMYKKKYWKNIYKRNLKTRLDLFLAPNIKKLRNKKNIEGLYTALQYKKFPFVNYEAAIALADINTDESLNALNRALSDENINYFTVIKVLGKNGSSKAIDILVEALNNKNIDLRMYAAKELRKFKSHRAIEPLISAYPKDHSLSDENIRIFAIYIIQALGEIGGEKVVEHMKKSLSSNYSVIRYNACKALDKANWDPDKDEIGAVFLCFKKRWDKCVPIGNGAIIPLSDALKEGEWGAAKALGKIGGSKATTELIKILIDKTYETKNVGYKRKGTSDKKAEDIERELKVEREIIRALVTIGDKQAVQPLINMIESDTYQPVALYALGQLGDERVVDILISALKNKPYASGIISAAASALGQIGSDKAVEPLIDLLEHRKKGEYKLVSWRDQEAYWAPDADAIAFQNIIEALGRIGDPRAIKPLKKLIDPKDISKHRQRDLSNAIDNIMKKNS